MSDQSALVTGGAGFIGSHLCDSLLADGWDVYSLDNFSSGQPENVSHLETDEQFSIIRADITNDVDLPDVDEIYHLASQASPKDFKSAPLEIALTNSTGTNHLLKHARDTDSKMLYASTSEVYGDPEVHPQPESYNGNVSIRGPRSCYDESKRFGETLSAVYNQEFDVDVRTVRLFNTYGPRMQRDDGRVVPTFLTQALTGQDLTVYGDGSQTRSFTYISDTVDGIRAVMNEPALSGDVVNIGNDDEITILELAERVLDLCEKECSVTHEQLPEDDPSRRCPEMKKMKSKLDWTPIVELQEGLTKTIEFFS